MAPTIDKHLLQLVNKIYGHVKSIPDFVVPKKATKLDKKNIILFVGKIYAHMVDAIRAYEKENGVKYRIGLIYHHKEKFDQYTQNAVDNKIDFTIPCDTRSDAAIQQCLLPFADEILAITTRPENQIPLLSKIVPHLPYIKTPTVQSLHWATDKLAMRERLATYDPRITPEFTIVADKKKSTLKAIEEKVGFPLIVKPTGLAASRLVSICYHKEELEEVLKLIFKKIEAAYKEKGGTFEPRILVEQFMEGDMYSIDGYVNETGDIHFCPMAHIKTGKRIGFDDFFGYQQMTPTLLNKDNLAQAEFVAAEAIHAVGLRNTTAHVELLRTEQGWKVIEIGPRVGGFRHMMYEYSFGINHTMNDILIRIGQKPKIPKKTNGYTVAMKFFAKQEGKLKKIGGIKKAQDLKSFKRLYVNKKIGDPCLYAKHGGDSVFNIIMFNKDRSDLLADIRRLEKMIDIETE